MLKDLKLEGNEANVAITIFFVPYILFEIPSNLLMKRLKPHIWCRWLSIMLGWRPLISEVEQYQELCSYSV